VQQTLQLLLLTKSLSHYRSQIIFVEPQGERSFWWSRKERDHFGGAARREIILVEPQGERSFWWSRKVRDHFGGAAR
jgi:hypothetical protein